MSGFTFHQVEVLVRVQQRLEAAPGEAAAEALHHFHRLSPSERELLVALEVGILTPSEQRECPVTHGPFAPQDLSAELAA